MLASSGSGADVKQAIDLAYLHGKQHGIFSSVQETFPNLMELIQLTSMKPSLAKIALVSPGSSLEKVSHLFYRTSVHILKFLCYFEY